MDSSATGDVAAVPSRKLSIKLKKPDTSCVANNNDADDPVKTQTSSSTHYGNNMDGRTFAVNEECTSLKFSPSGRLVAAGFADGTLRLFDLTGTYNSQASTRSSCNNSSSINSSNSSAIQDAGEDSDSCSENEAFASGSNKNMAFLDCGSSTIKDKDPAVLEILRRRHKTGKMVLSKEHQQYGAVACQIHAKGVHTALLMDVDIADDCQWCFAGALRGSMELAAVHLGALEASLDEESNAARSTTTSNQDHNDDERNLLDLVTVYRHGDAKLRGFGACTRLRSCEKYLLLTGKAIKNIHIWSFTPPRQPGEPPAWECLYDTATNGNTIKLLAFRHTASNHLQALSKSDNQKLRVWDLQQEEERATFIDTKSNSRPTRPPFHDVANTESLLGISAEFGVCGGDEFFNQMSIVRLDTKAAAFNHTEIALPCAAAAPSRGGSRRPQRGDLKCVVSVAGGIAAGRHALLELSDGSVTHYHSGSKTTSAVLRSVLPALPEGQCRQLAVGRRGCHVFAVVATYNPSTGQGNIWLRVLDKEDDEVDAQGQKPGDGIAKTNAPVAARVKAANATICSEMKVPTTMSNKNVAAHFSTEMNASTIASAETSTCASSTNAQASSNSIGPTMAASVKKTSDKMVASAQATTMRNTNREVSDTAKTTCRSSSAACRRKTSTAKLTAVATTEKAGDRLAKIVTATKKHPRIGADKSVNKTALRGDKSLVTPRTAPSSTVSSVNSTYSRASSSCSLFLARRLATPLNADEGNKPRVSLGSNDEEPPSKELHTTAAAAPTTATVSSLKDSQKRKKERNESSLLSIEEQQPRSKKRLTIKLVKNVPSVVPVPPTDTAEANPSLPQEPPMDVSTAAASLASLRESMRSPAPTANDDRSILLLGLATPSFVRSPMPYASRRDPGATRELIFEVCRQKLAEVASLLHEHSHAPSVWERRAVFGKLQQENNRAAAERYKLLAEHREAHRRLRQQILIMVQRTIKSIQEAPSHLTLDQARGFFHAALDVYQQQADALIERQWLENVTLGAVLRDRDPNDDNLEAPHPSGFPTIFAQARQCFPEIVHSL